MKDINLDKYLFVRQEDYAGYEHLLPEFKIIKLTSVKDIGETRACIIRYLISKKIDWAFMFDDDISKVETLVDSPRGYISNRIASTPYLPPRIEQKALLLWHRIAQYHDLSISSPMYRPFVRFSDPNTLYINKKQPIQCVLIQTKDILAVGNYKSINLTGNEDLYILYQLMNQGKKIGVISNIEYDCPAIGSGAGGCNAAEKDVDLKTRYYKYVQLFLNNVCGDPNKILVRRTKQGTVSIKFNWKSWEGEKITL